MGAYEDLAVLTAMQKAVKERLDEVRAEADAGMGDGIEKRTLSVGGEKVGEITQTFSKDGWRVVDMEALQAFALDYGFAHVEKVIRPEWMETCVKALEAEFDADVTSSAIEERIVLNGDWESLITKVDGEPTYLDSGMVVPGIEYRPKAAKGTRVTGCKPSDVIPILRGLPGGMDRALIGDA